MASLSQEFEIAFHEDVYVGRTRGTHPEWMLNLGGIGVQVIDIARGRAVQTIPFPDWARDFWIEGWLVSPDGSRSYLFHREHVGFALELRLDEGSVERIQLPEEFEATTGLCWFSPNLHMLDYHGSIWVLRNSSVDWARSEHLPKIFFEALHLDRQGKALGVLRTSEEHQGLYVMNNADIGFVSLSKRHERLVSHAGKAIDAAVFDNSLVVCAKDRLTMWREDRNDILMTPNAGEVFIGIETLSVARKVYLIVLSIREDGSGSILRGYILP